MSSIVISIKNGKVNVNFKENGNDKHIRKKGHSLLMFPDNYTVIDLETTGYNPEYDSIIEIACIKYRNNVETDHFQSLIQPTTTYDDGIWIDEFIAELTGITNEMLKTAPTFNNLANDIWDFLNGEFIIGHNVNFDINFLYDYFQNTTQKTFSNDFSDTLRISRKILPELTHHRLDDLSDYFNIDTPHHRALNDCIITNKVLEGLKQVVKENGIDLCAATHSKNLDLREIHGDELFFQKDHIFYDRNCVFTGKLERFSRKDAAQIVSNIGGHCQNGVTKDTNFLIVGNFDYVGNIKNGESGKMKKAKQFILKGKDLKIITENTFYDLLIDSIS